jgi:hypothetical protein
MSPLPELRAHLTAFAARCKAARWFGPAFHVRTADLILEDVAANEATAARLAHQNECAELAAERTLRDILADGIVTAPELRLLRQLPVTLARCAKRSHDLTETLA